MNEVVKEPKERVYKKVTELQAMAHKTLGDFADVKKVDRKHYGRLVVELKIKGRSIASGPIEWMDQFLQGVKYGLSRRTETKISVANSDTPAADESKPAA